MTSLRDSKLYQAFLTKTLPEIWTACYDFCISGKNVNMQDVSTKETYMHLLAENISRFTEPDGVTVIYIMACKGIDMDIQDLNGDTFLHRVVRVPGTYRVIVAALRTGANPLIQNNEGKTPEDILIKDSPSGWQENLHWLTKFLPGLYAAVKEKVPDRSLVEKLLKSWCRVHIVKDRKPCNLKLLASGTARTHDLAHLIENHENTIEFVMAILSGKAMIIRKWISDHIMENIDINTKDHSYQYNYVDYQCVPQPLLASAWEQNDYGVVDVLMELGVDTATVFSYGGVDEKPKPLFFQLISGKVKPKNEIVQRIIEDSDLSVKNTEGQTLVFEAIEQDYPESFIKSLFKLGANVAARDRYGRTARDYAGFLNKTKYFRVIDDHVLQFIRECNIQKIENLIIQGYKLSEITDREGYSVMEIAKRQCSHQLLDVVQKENMIRDHIKSMFEAVQTGKLQEVKKVMGKKLANGQDMCGRTVLHKAVLHKNTDVIKYLVSEFPNLLNTRDNFGRTPLHYAQLFLEGKVLEDMMSSTSADLDSKDIMGRTPSEYNCEVCGKRKFCELQKEVTDTELDVFLIKTGFEDKLKKAIQQEASKRKIAVDVKEFSKFGLL
ncbi:hypothetical protein KUTeg_018355 [Tegillarca granosa]|uniref:Uncharacterized protein n=1 Tax=Tegillarca granosa TaxID=220873 RepID=A0ABQ9ELI4_TEGGR|nr:hypothetical protein KUTeg_018355 [Tegillarca granosa]